MSLQQQPILHVIAGETQGKLIKINYGPVLFSVSQPFRHNGPPQLNWALINVKDFFTHSLPCNDISKWPPESSQIDLISDRRCGF